MDTSVAGGDGTTLTLTAAARLLLTDPGVLNRRAAADEKLVVSFKLYAVGAGLGLAVTEVVGEDNTGALYVFGGSVFGEVPGIGEWLAFLAIVPVLAGALALLYIGSGVEWRRHAAFALHFGAVVGVATAIEALLVATLGSTPLADVADFIMIGVAAVFYFLAVIDTYGSGLSDMLRGYGAVAAIFAAWVALTLLLAELTGFRL